MDNLKRKVEKVNPLEPGTSSQSMLEEYSRLTKELNQVLTERESLRKTVQLFTEAVEQIPVGALIRENSTGNIIKTNSEWERIIGLKNLEGRNFFDLYGKDDGWACYTPDNTLCSLEDLPSYKTSVDSNKAKNVELLLHAADGSKRWILVNTAPIFNDKGRITAVAILMQDINKHKKNEEKIRENEERLNYALTASDEGLWDFDYQNRTGYLSPRYFEMLGYSNKEFSGNYDDWVNLLHPEDKSRAIEIFLGMEDQDSDFYRSEYRLRNKEGKYLWILSRAIVAERGASNEVLRIVGTHLDITESKKMEEELRRANEKLERQVHNRTQELNKSRSLGQRAKEELTELTLLDTSGRGFIAKSPEMKQMLKTAIKLSQLHVANILITGDSGTGKSRLAKFIHQVGNGSKKPFVQINCAALPETLLEAELFGYEKGAFTGARDEGKIGLFELAQGGTLFLDEIGEMSLTIQAKLLKYLDDKEIMHLGGLKPIKINCMVIAATNAPLAELIQKRSFREDLFFRLNTFSIHLPSLNERPEDLLKLVDFFLNRYNKQYGLKRRISALGYKAIEKYTFPGNVRELQNLINKAVVLSDSDSIDETILEELKNVDIADHPHTDNIELDRGGFNELVAKFEKDLLLAAKNKHKTTRAIALHLKMTQSSVVRRLKKYNISQ